MIHAFEGGLEKYEQKSEIVAAVFLDNACHLKTSKSICESEINRCLWLYYKTCFT